MTSLLRRLGGFTAVSALVVALSACWTAVGGDRGESMSCEAQSSNSSGFVLVETRCHRLQEGGHHQQAGVRCKGEVYFQGGNMVWGNGVISRVERFCGNLGYEYVILLYLN